MAIGERIHFFRTLRGMTQKYLGMAVGFPERSADVRLAQYETGTRTPKADLTAALAQTLDVSPQALSVPDIDNYSLKVVEADGRACLQADIFQGGRQASELNKILIAWREQAAKLEAGEITKEDYDRWRYNYPKYDTTQRWAKVPSKELSDALIKGLKKQRKDK